MSEVLKKVPTDEVVETLYNDLRSRVEAVEPNDAMVAPDYADLTLPILVGTRCTHNRGLYKCNTQINSSEAWDSTHWDEVTVGSELDTVNSQVIVSASQPQESNNKLWIKNGSGDEYTVPTYAEHQELLNAIHSIIPLEPKDIMSAQIGRNLFNKYTASEGYYVDKNTGNLVANSSYVSSDYIEVEPSTRYGCNYEGHFAWYTEDKTYISGGSETNALNSPSTAKYLRIDTTKTRINRFMVCKGIARSENDQGFEYNVYFPWLKAKADIDAFAFEKYGAVVVNMFNKSTAEDGKYVDATNGYFVASANYFRSDYIPVEPNTEYRVSYRNRYAVYDSNYQYITGANLDNGNSYKFTTPNNAAYVVICGTPLSRKDEYVIAKTSDFPAGYESYGVIVPWIKHDVPKSKYDGKTLVCFGDSITSDGYTQFIEADTGMTAINQGYASGRYAYSSESSQYVNAFALHNIIYAIATGDWTIPNTIIDVSEYAIQNQRLALLKTLDFDNVDFVSFAYGTNDFMSATSLDNPNDKYDTNTVKGAVRYSIKTLLTAYPHIKIIGATPIYRFWSSGGVIVSDCDNREVDGKYLKDYAEAIKEAFAECHMPCVDNLSQAGINEFNRLYYFNIDDGTHPKDSGREIIGHRIGAAILEQL